MILAALTDCGLQLDDLQDGLALLGVGGYSLNIEKTSRSGVYGTKMSVDLDQKGRVARDWHEFTAIIEESGLSSDVIETSIAVIRRLAEAEAVAHGVALDEVHFHELSTVDTLVDVVGTVLGLKLMGVERVFSSPLPTGSGQVQTEHGLLPVPTPAMTAIVSAARVPLVPPPGGIQNAGEMVTPTGAALLVELSNFWQPSLNIVKAGYGLGSRESLYYPNVLGLWLGDAPEFLKVSEMSVIETNIDDTNAEVLGYVQERLFQLGALDVWFTSIQMKKNRPGTMLSALVPVELEFRAVELVMRETTTLGVRACLTHRYEADRALVAVETSLGTLNVKVKKRQGMVVAVYPEYEDCKRVALEGDLPLREVISRVTREASAILLCDL